jgi:predicted metal-dependent HD superfamily phosphohydrolase
MAHVRGVAQRAAELGTSLHEDGDLLVIAAWLHDVGYSSHARRSGFHPLDGALYLHDAGYSDRLCALAAHHSAAEIEAKFFGCSEDLAAFADERTLIRDLLWYCDMSIGLQGAPISFAERMEDVRARYSADDYVIRALDASMPERVGAVTRAEAWIESVGLDGYV